jgi:hypothetical protein
MRASQISNTAATLASSSIASISVVISPFENRHDLHDDEEEGMLDPKPECPADPPATTEPSQSNAVSRGPPVRTVRWARECPSALLPFAQIAARIGGAIKVTIVLFLLGRIV